MINKIIMSINPPKMRIEGTASVWTKWQIVIPKSVREKLDLKTWSDLVVLSSDFATILIKSENLKEMVSHFESIIEQTKSIK
jgi:AbrB family looped-hinge helix DNA binding protein